MRPPASWTISLISVIWFSKTPIVFGLVSMSPAVWGPAAAVKASRSTVPESLLCISTVLKPAMFALAGFVPWPLSGMIISVRLSSSPLSLWYCLMSIIPVHSPWAPAAGWSVASSIPVTSRKYPLKV